MAYSGSRTFNLTIEEIIEEAFERCGLEVRSGYDLKTARRSLNLMFSDWANRGLNLWTIDYATQTMTAGTNYYAVDQKVVDIIDATITTTADATANLDGDQNTTDVAITKTFVRMYRAFVVHVGSSKENEGAITIEIDETTTAGIYINATDGQTQQSGYTIPSGKTGYFIKGYVGIGRGGTTTNSACAFTLRARPNNGSSGMLAVKGQLELFTNGMPYWQYEYGVPVALGEKTDVILRCEEVSRNGMQVVGAFDIILVDN